MTTAEPPEKRNERNFRSSYYEKVGFKSVEELKSLEILLKDNPLDKTKLIQFFLRFTPPGVHRNLCWTILLGILPVHMESHTFIWKQRKEQYEDLMEALTALRIVDAPYIDTSKIILCMWLLESRKLKLDVEIQMETPRYKSMSAIPSALALMCRDNVDLYWISRGFFTFVDKFYPDIHKLAEPSKTCLEKEEPELYGHLVSVGAMEYLPFEDWFCSCFASVLHEVGLNKIWDKLLAGACKILTYVAVVLITSHKKALLNCTAVDDILMCLKNVSEEGSDAIANQAIELWQLHGSYLTPLSGPDALKLSKTAKDK